MSVLASIVFVLGATFIVYSKLQPIDSFWDAQFWWSIGLIACWIVVASGYYHQGWLVRKQSSAKNVSVVLPMAVFCVQCILFVKGIFYDDWSLILGALLVNSGVLFSLYNIFRVR